MSTKVQHFHREGLISSKDEFAHEVYNTDDEVERFLKPLVIYLKFLGISLKLSDSVIKNRLNCLLGWLVLVITLSWNIYISCNFVFANYEQFTRVSTFSITMFVGLTSDILFKLLNHVALLKLAKHSKYQELMKIIHRLSFSGLKIRQYSTVALVLFLLVS